MLTLHVERRRRESTRGLGQRESTGGLREARVFGASAEGVRRALKARVHSGAYARVHRGLTRAPKAQVHTVARRRCHS